MATFFDFRPAKNFIGILPHTDIYFSVEDANGVDISTLEIYIGGVLAIHNGIFQAGFLGALTPSTPARLLYFINVNPDVNFLFDEHVTVGISVKNQLGQKFSDFYSFDIILNPDNTRPETIPYPRGNRFNTPITVTLSVFDENTTTTYYTVNGSDPKTNGILYSAPISISSEKTTVLKFYSRDDDNANVNNDNVEDVKQETYILDFTAPITTPSITSNTFFAQQYLILTVNEPSVTYFTIDGSNPTSSNTRQIYSPPIVISKEGVTVVKFYSIDYANNIESIHTETYTISYAKSNFIVSNAMVSSPYIRGVLDVVWDDMQHMDSSVLGYNIYRSYFWNGPYTRLNKDLLPTTHYRDAVSDLEIIQEDVSYQFQQTVAINRFASDNFVGNTYDPSKWVEYDSSDSLFQSDGLIFEDLIGRHYRSSLTSIFKFSGDFDCFVDLDLTEWNIPNSEFQFAGIKVHRRNGNGIVFERKRGQNTEILSSATFTNGFSDSPITTNNNQTVILLRVTRVNGTITTSFEDVFGNSILHNSFSNYDMEPLYVSLVFGSADRRVSVKANRFVVNSGNVVIVKPFDVKLDYVIKTQRRPIVDSVVGSTGNTKYVDLFQSSQTNQNIFVKVEVDGIEAKIREVNGLEGEIILDKERYYDYIIKEYIQPVLPNEDSKVVVIYFTRNHDVDYSLRKPLYYKITAQNDCGETDLSLIKPITLQAESLDYIYAEAMRRNHWLLDQAGETVLLFQKARAGVRCQCYLDNERTHRQSKNTCPICYGVGFIPPYANPLCIKISPAMAEQKIMQTDRGIRLDYQTEIWCVVPVVINQRDFLLRRDGTILGVGAQTAPEMRGRRLDQQHFTIQPVDRSDVRYDYIELLNLFDNRKKLGIPCVDFISVAKQENTCPNVATKGRTLTFGNIQQN